MNILNQLIWCCCVQIYALFGQMLKGLRSQSFGYAVSLAKFSSQYSVASTNEHLDVRAGVRCFDSKFLICGPFFPLVVVCQADIFTCLLFTAGFQIMTSEAEIESVRFTKSVIKSSAALSYIEAQARMDDRFVCSIRFFIFFLHWVYRYTMFLDVKKLEIVVGFLYPAFICRIDYV